MREMWLLFAAALPPKCTCGLEYGQIAQRTTFPASLLPFLRVLTPPGPTQAQMGS